MRIRFLMAGGLLGLASIEAAPRLELGANFNEHLHVARIPVLDATGVEWIRGFLPAGEFLHGGRTLAGDPGTAAFRAAAGTGRRVAISLKWDFKRSQWRVPAPESAEEGAAFAWAVEAVRVTRPDLLLLINELFVDTHEIDLEPGPDGIIPMVRFLERLAGHVAAAGLRSPAGDPLPVSCGGFTRINTPRMQQHPATRALLPWLASSPHLTHVNFHMHQASLAEFADALRFMGSQVPHRPFVVTEFSVVWAYQAALEEELGLEKPGREFCVAFDRDPTTTVATYLNQAARVPLAEVELHAFLASRTWFDPNFLRRSCEMMEQGGVVLATYAYLQESSGLENPRRELRAEGGQPPWRLNPVFQERHARSPDDGRMAVNLGIYDSFVQWLRRSR